MPTPVLSTYEILYKKAFNLDIDESWIDWAIEMMEAGYESENLYMLAGQTPFYNQFELRELTNKVFDDLGISYTGRDRILRDYTYFIIKSSIDKPETYLGALRKLNNIFDQLKKHDKYWDFKLLYYAKDELDQFQEQFYWSGANRANIDSIIKKEFAQWIADSKPTDFSTHE